MLALLSLVAALLAWTGAHAAGANVPLSGLMLAATNCLGVAVLFLGLAALGYALAPRAATSIAYTLVGDLVPVAAVRTGPRRPALAA